MGGDRVQDLGPVNDQNRVSLICYGTSVGRVMIV